MILEICPKCKTFLHKRNHKEIDIKCYLECSCTVSSAIVNKKIEDCYLDDCKSWESYDEDPEDFKPLKELYKTFRLNAFK